MLINCREVHLIDPHFGPENPRHRKLLEALTNVLADREVWPEIIRVNCSAKSRLQFFEDESTKMANRLPVGATVEFVRWKEKAGSERLHNRYILTDIGGVMLGVGLDAGATGETDDLFLLTRTQYDLRWSQYIAADGTFDCVDRPSPVMGAQTRRP
jgi:hypothetical protein